MTKTANKILRNQDSFKIGKTLVSLFPNWKISVGSLHWYSDTGVDLELWFDRILYDERRLGDWETWELILMDLTRGLGARR